MYRIEPVASTFLDIAEKSRAYGRHTNALMTNPHTPLTSPPVISPSVIAFEKRRKYERNFMINDEKRSSKKIDEIWKRAHNYKIEGDTTQLKPELHTRSSPKRWSALLKECEANFPDKEEIKKMKNPKTETFSTGSCESNNGPQEQVSGMEVFYSSNPSNNCSPKKQI